jgi:hypothetical protein
MHSHPIAASTAPASPLRVRRLFRGAVREALRHYPGFAAGMGGIVLAWLLVEWIVIFSPLSSSRIAWWVAHLGYFILTAVPEAALLRLGYAVGSGGRAGWDALPSFRSVVGYTLLKFLVLPPLLVGLGLLVVPGIYAGARLLLSGPLVVTRSQNAFEAFRRSVALSRHHVAALMRLTLVLVLLNLLGLSLMGMGLLLTLPVSYVVLGRALHETVALELSRPPSLP